MSTETLKTPSLKLQFAIAFFIALAVFTLLQIWFLGNQLPAEVPVHFGIDGQPDRFSSRGEHLWTMTSLVIGTTIFLLGICWLTPKIPDSMINLPNKEYWLAPERRQATIIRVQTMLVWVGVLTTLLFSTLAFLSWLVGMQYAASISPWFWIAVVIYMGTTMYLCLGNFRLTK